VITPDILHDHVETDLDFYALERYIDDAYAAIEERVGLIGTVSQTFDPVEGEFLFLDPAADLVTAVTEDDTALLEGDEYDYVLRFDGRALRRTFGRWWGRTVVEWEVGDDPRRDRVAIDLCKLALQYEGLQSSGDGDYDESHLEYQAERNRLISELASVLGFA
jgi:hypothetical protein